MCRTCSAHIGIGRWPRGSVPHSTVRTSPYTAVRPVVLPPNIESRQSQRGEAGVRQGLAESGLLARRQGPSALPAACAGSSTPTPRCRSSAYRRLPRLHCFHIPVPRHDGCPRRHCVESPGGSQPQAARHVAGFQHREDAELFLRDLTERFGRLGLRRKPMSKRSSRILKAIRATLRQNMQSSGSTPSARAGSTCSVRRPGRCGSAIPSRLQSSMGVASRATGSGKNGILSPKSHRSDLSGVPGSGRTRSTSSRPKSAISRKTGIPYGQLDLAGNREVAELPGRVPQYRGSCWSRRGRTAAINGAEPVPGTGNTAQIHRVRIGTRSRLGRCRTLKRLPDGPPVRCQSGLA